MNFVVVLYALGFALLGYLSGSLPFAVWITRLVKGVDVRDNGSGHATTTNTIRQVGFLPGAAVFILDVSKGFLPTWLAIHYAPATWMIALTAGMAVIGHCWPIFAGFRGGMGLATANGGLMASVPVAILITGALLIVLTLIIRQSARASVIAGLLFAPVLWVAGLRGPVIWIAIVVGIIITLRFTIDWNREYKELWLDRDKENPVDSND
jgi:glycerol-3-phosphate acyltransferase PlsY